MQKPATGLEIEGRAGGVVSVRAIFGGEFEYVLDGERLIRAIRAAMQEAASAPQQQLQQGSE